MRDYNAIDRKVAKMSSGLAGQWIGPFSGTNNGLAMLDLDEVGDRLEGSAYAFDAVPNTYHSYVQIKVERQAESFEISAPIHPVDPNFPVLVQPANVPDGSFGKFVTVAAKLNGDTLNVSWETDLGTVGEAKLQRSKAAEPSQLQPEAEVVDWSTFQDRVDECVENPRRFVFRGQSAPWRLRTAFHRTSRKDLWRYWHDDIPRIRGAVVGKTNQHFRFGKPEEMGAFLHLLQHYGFPTPLLDWTYSPYVAAFFAYASARPEINHDKPVRIFMFDAQEWQKDFQQVLHVTLCQPHFSLIEPLALGNDRALPQQSLASITNLDDVERYIRWREKEEKKTYLRVFDLAAEDRLDVLARLSLMGISPGSMFPGIEGVCREFRERNFGPRPW